MSDHLLLTYPVVRSYQVPPERQLSAHPVHQIRLLRFIIHEFVLLHSLIVSVQLFEARFLKYGSKVSSMHRALPAIRKIQDVPLFDTTERKGLDSKPAVLMTPFISAGLSGHQYSE